MTQEGDDGVRIHVDRTRCDGSRLCAELLPELIRLDDWGYPILKPGPIPKHLLPHARRAVASCPLLALRFTGNSQPSPKGS
jgi:ferredoxin